MKKKILVVDDNRVMLKFLTTLMEREGHEVVTAEDGFSALDILTYYVPDIIFVDLIMPKIGGDKLCKIVRKMEHLKDCYVVVVSAAVAEMDFDYASIGADKCIAKGPFPSMSENVKAVIAGIDMPDTQGDAKPIMGLDDVHERRMTKELLLRSRHLETILESISEGILEVYSDKIVYANSSAAVLFGLPQEKLLAMRPLALFDSKMRPLAEKQLRLRGDNAVETREHTPIEMNGRLITLKEHPVKGETASSIIIITDITDQKRLELQLQHVQKMDAIGTIASGVAHNFRNTLAGILVNNQVLQMEFEDLPGLKDITDRISSSVKRGVGLVEGLTQFSRKQTLEDFHRVDLSEIIREIHQLIRDSFDKKIDIQIDIPESLPIQGDHSGISQALLNLCTNARDAMPGGGNLRIQASRVHRKARIVVSDTGQGMNAKIREKCFDPFFTTKEVGKGTGLGLSTTYGIVKGHEGDIILNSEPGKGAKFELYFRLAEDKTEAEAVEEYEIVQGKGETVLVVDDEIELLEAMPKLLKALGYRSALAKNAQEAIETYKAFQPDIVLMDKNMPDMDGIAASEKILEIDPDAVIAIISGYDLNGPDGIPKEKMSFLKGYLTKPVDAAQLSNLLLGLLKNGKTGKA